MTYVPVVPRPQINIFISICMSFVLNSVSSVCEKQREDSFTFKIIKETKITFYPIPILEFTQNVIFKRNFDSDTMYMSWDERIRTSEYRDQNPLPYHLATPHLDFHSTLLKNNSSIGSWSIPGQMSIENLYRIN